MTASPAQPAAAPLRLAVYTDTTGWGGAENSLGHLLSALDPTIAVTVVGVDATVVDRLVERRPSSDHLLLPEVRDKRSLRPIVAHVRAIRRLRPDILQANLRHPWSCQYGIVAGLLAGTPVVAVEHLPLPASSSFQRRLKRFTSKRLAAHVAVGHQAARDVERLADLRAGSVRTIHNGVPDRGACPPPAGGGAIGAVGRLEQQKGLDVLLRALVELPDARVVLIGDGPERPALTALADQLGVADRVRFAGWVDDPHAALCELDVVALPSRFEAFPLTLVEAMLAARPVVASDVGSVAEAVVDGETGLLVPADDVPALSSALREMLADADRRAAMGRDARQIAARRFTPEAMARAYEALYAEIRRTAPLVS